MTFPRSARFLAIPIALALGFPSVSFGLANIGTWSFLRNTPAELFSKEDWAIFQATLEKALDAGQEGEVNTWENPKSQYSGEITVLRTLARSGRECRAVRITSQAADRSRTSVQIFCRSGDGAWQLEPPPSRTR